jgi:lactoylglutathione lyase
MRAGRAACGPCGVGYDRCMRIEHVALWTADLERLRQFYETYFGARANTRYSNPAKRFQSYFLTFASGARLEIMQRPDVVAGAEAEHPALGWAHVAFSAGSEHEVEQLTQRLARDGYSVVDGPRRTGDGYYESVVLDPDGNRVEITV